MMISAISESDFGVILVSLLARLCDIAGENGIPFHQFQFHSTFFSDGIFLELESMELEFNGILNAKIFC
jgi:hypothetical protein